MNYLENAEYASFYVTDADMDAINEEDEDELPPDRLEADGTTGPSQQVLGTMSNSSPRWMWN